MLKPLALAAAIAVPGTAAAETLVACWDQSFSYTHTGISAVQDGVMLVMFATQDRQLLRPIVPQIGGEWGPAYLEIAYPKGSCTVSEAEDLFTCTAAAAEGKLVLEEPAGKRSRIALAFSQPTASFVAVRSADGNERRALMLGWQDGAGARHLIHDFTDDAICDGPWNALRE